MYWLSGRYEARGRKVLAKEWFALVQAPDKQMVDFPNSGHNPCSYEPARVLDTLRKAAAAHPA